MLQYCVRSMKIIEQTKMFLNENTAMEFIGVNLLIVLKLPFLTFHGHRPVGNGF